MQANAVEQLGFVGRHELCQTAGFGFVGVVCCGVGGAAGGGQALPYGHAMQYARHFFERVCG